jgi:hypothetical protein
MSIATMNEPAAMLNPTGNYNVPEELAPERDGWEEELQEYYSEMVGTGLLIIHTA